MRHRKTGVKLNRTSSHRQAMFRNMVTSLFKHERIRTTDVKAKELRRWADKMITLAKRGDLHARRQALAVIREKEVVYKLFNEAAERFGKLEGGYTRVIKLGRRPGDSAPISMVELVSGKVAPKPAKKTAPAAPVEKRVVDVAEAPGKEAPAVDEAAEVAAAPESEIEADQAEVVETTAVEDTDAEPEAEASVAAKETEPAEEASAPADEETVDQAKGDKPAS